MSSVYVVLSGMKNITTRLGNASSAAPQTLSCRLNSLRRLKRTVASDEITRSRPSGRDLLSELQPVTVTLLKTVSSCDV